MLDEMMSNIEKEHKNREDQLSLFKNSIRLRQDAEKKRDDRFKQ